MNGGSNREREERAIDALLISALRREGSEVEVDPARLPKLNDAERAAMESLGENYIDKLLASEAADYQESGLPVREVNMDESNDLALAGSGSAWGLNRAEGIDELTAEELERRKKEILERLAKEKREKEGGSG